MDKTVLYHFVVWFCFEIMQQPACGLVLTLTTAVICNQLPVKTAGRCA